MYTEMMLSQSAAIDLRSRGTEKANYHDDAADGDGVDVAVFQAAFHARYLLEGFPWI